MAVPVPMLQLNYYPSSNAALRKRVEVPGSEDTFLALCEDQKDNIAKVIESRKRVFNYLSDTLQGKQRWMNVEAIHRDRWQMAYAAERGKKSYFKIGYSLGNHLNNAPNSLKEFLYDILAIIQYYEYLDNKKKGRKEVEKVKQPNLPLFVATTNGAINNNISNKTNDVDEYKGFKFSSLFKPKRFFRKSLKKSPSQSPLQIDFGPRKSKDQISITSEGHDSITTVNSSTTIQTQWSSPNRKTLPRNIAKSPRLAAVITSLSTPSNQDMPFEPDQYESVLSLIDMFRVVMDDILIRLKKDGSGYIELIELFSIMCTVDNAIRELLFGKSIKSVDQAMNGGRKREAIFIERAIGQNNRSRI